ncbi:MAG: hypothetical protein ICV83_15315 [Cytophagales bacterium]|nr:hypothetical protein [Cytophagales bacterium]
MRKQKGNTTPAPAGGIAGWLSDRGQAPGIEMGRSALFPLRAAYARYKAIGQQWKKAVARQGEAVSADEITRRDARMPLFNFTGSAGALQWWPGDHHNI